MGQRLTYKCTECEYSVLTSGGRDAGMVAVTDTYICRACREIVDVEIGEYGSAYTREEIINDRDKSESGINFYTCPHCGSGEHLVKWDTKKRPCPKCGARMEKDPGGVRKMWD